LAAANRSFQAQQCHLFKPFSYRAELANIKPDAFVLWQANIYYLDF